MGVNTGEVVVRSITTGEGRAEYAPVGHSTGIAARMQALAPVGSIAATEQIRKLCEGYFLFRSLGPTKVKGVSEPINVYEVSGLGPLRTRLQRAAARGYTKFVGRAQEMAALHRVAEQARAGHGQIVAVVAEAGTGKSRLFYEFKAKNESGWKVLEAFSFAHGKASAYLPVIELLHSYFDIKLEDEARKRREKATGRVVALDRSLEDTLPYLFALLGIAEGDPLAGMDPEIRRGRTLDAVKRILLRESLNQPLMLIFEDVHWIDGETQRLLNLLADSIASSKILLLVNHRPEYAHQWGNKTSYTQLRLDPLGRESAAEMLDCLLGAVSDLGPLKRFIIERTEGNPFFMEEIVQALFDQAVLTRNGAVKLAKPLSEIRLPPTVQGVLASRIDRLGREEKDLLQTLAVIGREFPLSLVREVTKASSENLDHAMCRLQVAEFIYEQPGMGDVSYSFKHALTREVAYRTLLLERRKSLHERAALALVKTFKESLNDHLDEIARHYSQSANLPRAVEYLRYAGEAAIRRFAYPSAMHQLHDALGLLQTLPESVERDRQELPLQMTLGKVVGWEKGHASADYERAFSRARELCTRLGDEDQLFAVLEGLTAYLDFTGELRTARQLEEQMLTLAQRAKDPERLTVVDSKLANTSFLCGEFESSLDYYSGDANAFRSWSLWTLGYPDHALLSCNESLQVTREWNQPFPLAVALFAAALIHLRFRDTESAHRYAEEAVAIAAENGFSFELARARFLNGAERAILEKRKEGISEMTAAMESILSTGASMRTYQLALLAEAYSAYGCIEEGFATVDDSLATHSRTTEAIGLPELYRVRGELLLVARRGAEAESAFRQAIVASRKQNAKSWELRATTSLARLLAKQSRGDEARKMLAEIYGWFTEGFDTPDLKDAKALLDELSVGS